MKILTAPLASSSLTRFLHTKNELTETISIKFQPTESKFSGPKFYQVYKDAEFLKSNEYVETILSQGYMFRQNLKKVAPGDFVAVEKMFVEKDMPLIVKNTAGPNVTVKDYEFTLNRLTGVAAAYVYENRLRFPALNASEAETLRLDWDHQNDVKCKLYLAAVTGTEHYPNLFDYFPLVCALRKLQLKKITLEPVLKIAKIKNDQGVTMATDLKNNFKVSNLLWQMFPETSNTDMEKMFHDAPAELKKMFEYK